MFFLFVQGFRLLKILIYNLLTTDVLREYVLLINMEMVGLMSVPMGLPIGVMHKWNPMVVLLGGLGSGVLPYFSRHDPKVEEVEVGRRGADIGIKASFYKRYGKILGSCLKSPFGSLV